MTETARSRSKSFCSTNEIFIIGEQLRLCVHRENLVQNRKYHLRTYRSCLVGKELLDWLVRNKHFDCRDAAIRGVGLLLKCSLIHHVCDDHEIKDDFLFYRFRRDDGTYLKNADLTLFYKALELHKSVCSRKAGIVKSYQQGGELFRNAFQGDQFVLFMLKNGHAPTREEAVLLGRRLLESDMIRHVTDDYHFRDEDHLLYQFTLDLDRPRPLSDLLHFVSHDRTSGEWMLHGHGTAADQEFYTPNSTPVNTPEVSRKRHSSSNTNSSSADSSECSAAPTEPRAEHSDEFEDRHRSMSADSGNSTDTSETSAEYSGTRSVLLRQATVHELESPNTPYVKHSIKISSDPVGYGFVIRGDSPTYVQAVDPMGPAAVAGLKVRQFIYSVNGQYVMQKDHKYVGKLIMDSTSHVTLVVMLHKRDAEFL